MNRGFMRLVRADTEFVCPHCRRYEFPAIASTHRSPTAARNDPRLPTFRLGAPLCWSGGGESVVFGALISAPDGFERGLRVSLVLAAAVALVAALAATRMAAARHGA